MTQASTISPTPTTPLAPLPRYRLYTSLRSYRQSLTELLFAQTKKANACQELEEAVAQQFNVKHVIAVSQARVGIYLAVKHLVPQGKELIMSPYTIADVVNMVISAGAKPVFCDLEAHTCNLDSNKLSKLITPKTGGILITHLHGLAANPELCRTLADQHGLPLIEDSAQACGAVMGDKRTGTFGEAGIYSLGMYKNVNAWYGGLIATNNDRLSNALREEINQFDYESATVLAKRVLKGLITDTLTWPPVFKSLVFWLFRFGCLHDIEAINRRVRTELDTKRYDQIKPRYLRRLTQTQARIALPQFADLDSNTSQRIEKAQCYYNGLKELSEVILPPPQFDGSHIYTYYPIRVSKREAMLKWLMKHRCDVGAQHLKNCASLTGFDEFGDCPIAEATAKEVVLLPTYPSYSNRDVMRNIETIKRFFAQ